MKYKIEKIKLVKTITTMLLYGKNVYVDPFSDNSNNLGNAYFGSIQEYPEETSSIIKNIFCSIGIDAENTKNYLVNYCTHNKENLDYFYFLFKLFLNEKKFKYTENTNRNIIFNENLMKILFIFFNNVDRSIFSNQNNKNIFKIINIQDLYNLILANVFFKEIEYEDKCSTIFNFIEDNMYDNTYTFDIYCESFKKIICENIWEALLNIVTEPVLYLASKIYKYDYVTILHGELYQDHDEIINNELWHKSYMYNNEEVLRKNIRKKVYLCMHNTDSSILDGKYNVFHMLEESLIFLFRYKILKPQFD